MTLSAQDNAKILQQLKTVFKRTFRWNIDQSEPTMQAQNQYLMENYFWSVKNDERTYYNIRKIVTGQGDD